MVKILRYSFLIGLLFLMVIISFFFWASSSNLSPNDYEKIIAHKITPKLNNDSIYSVITYNVGYLSGMTNNKAIDKPESLFDTNLKLVKEKIKAENADILALQEIDFESERSHNVNQQDEIVKTGYGYVAQSINWDERHVPFPYWPLSMHFGKIISGQSIVSKYPIQSHERKVLKRVVTTPYYKDVFYLDRLAQIVKITIEGKELVVINIHLEAFDKKTRTQQMEYVVNLYKQYYEKQPTLLLGDFNSDPDYKEACIYLALNLPKTGCAAFSKESYENTFSTDNPYERLDYIFYNKKFIEYIDGKVLSNFGEISDHFPVKMNFKFLNEKKLLSQSS